MQPDVCGAIIFDCDGTLVDTEPLAWSILARVLSRHGYLADETDRVACLGRTEADCHNYLSSRATLPPARTFSRECRTELTKALREQGVSPFPDVPQVLGELRRRQVPLAVASSSSRARLLQVLEAAHLLQHFDVVISAQDVRSPKPNPEPFLLAAERLGIRPEDCLAVEDSLPGVTSALAAGMRVLHVARGQASIAGAIPIQDLQELSRFAMSTAA